MVLAAAWIVVVWAIAHEARRRAQGDVASAPVAPVEALVIATATAGTME
jgi:hypothetical protein